MKQLKTLVALAGLLSATTVANAGTLLGNFEAGSLDGWSAQPGTTTAFDTFGATLGTSSLKVTIPAGWNYALVNHPLSLTPDLALPNSIITFDLTMRNDGGQIPPWWLGLEMSINSDTTGNQSLPLQGGFPGVPWGPTTYQLTYSIPASVSSTIGSATWVNLDFIGNTGAGGATFWIDNMQISQVPEPASFGLLGLGGLMLFLRRRNS
jgi:hypothetical protein